jgi:uncharacterized membrane protein
VFLLLLDQAFQLLAALATPFTIAFPFGYFDDVEFKGLAGLLLIVGMSFLLGLIVRSRAGARTSAWVERKTVGRIALYRVAKSLTTTLMQSGQDGASSFRPALFLTEQVAELAYIIEDQGHGPITIMLPWAPAPFAGAIKIVPRDRIRELEISLADFTKVLSHWGLGAQEALREAPKKAPIVGARETSARDESA